MRCSATALVTGAEWFEACAFAVPIVFCRRAHHKSGCRDEPGRRLAALEHERHWGQQCVIDDEAVR